MRTLVTLLIVDGIVFTFRDSISFSVLYFSEENYSVIDYCARNLIQMTELKDPLVPSSKFLIMLTMLENHEGKTIEMVRYS